MNARPMPLCPSPAPFSDKTSPFARGKYFWSHEKTTSADKEPPRSRSGLASKHSRCSGVNLARQSGRPSLDGAAGPLRDRGRKVFRILRIEVQLQDRAVAEPQMKRPAERVAVGIEI